MPTYLLFYESDIITPSDNGFNYFQRKSIVKNKMYCSFLDKKSNESSKFILESLTKFFPDCNIIEFGMMTFRLEREYFIAFTLFNTKETLFDNFDSNFYPRGNYEALENKTLEMRASLSQSLHSMIVKRFIANIFLPEQLKGNFRRTIEKILESRERREESSTKRYYQNYKRFPFLVEFQTNLFLNFKDELEKTINDFYTILSPYINETGTLFTFEFSFCDLKSYSLEKFDMSEVASTISISFLNYIFSLYFRIINSLNNYRNRIESLSRKLNTYPGKVLIELNEQLSELKRIIFEDYPLLYINVLDKYILYKEDVENPDLTNQFFWNEDTNLSMFRRNLKLLKEKIADIQTEIRTLLLYKLDRIRSFTKDELKEKLNSIEYEQVFRKEILIPILKDLGYDNIQDTHGQHEYGVDILFSNQNKFNLMEWNGIIAKIGDINLDVGTELSQNLKKIFKQIYQAKSMNHLEKNYGKVKITRVFIATNGKINYYAKNVLFQKDPLIKGNIFFIDYDVILSLF